MHSLNFCLLMVYQIIFENYFKARKCFIDLTIILMIHSFLDFRKWYAYKFEICNSLKTKLWKMHALVYNCDLRFQQQLHWSGYFYKGFENAKAMESNHLNLNTRYICSSFNLIFDLSYTFNIMMPNRYIL